MNTFLIFALLVALMLTGMPISISLGLTVLSFLFFLTHGGVAKRMIVFATDSIGTSVRRNRNERTVRPREIEIGMPVSISTTSSVKMRMVFMADRPS